MAVLAHAWRRESSKPFADGVPAQSYERGFGAESFNGGGRSLFVAFRVGFGKRWNAVALN